MTESRFADTRLDFLSLGASECNICARRRWDRERSCEAFPDGIPSPLYRGDRGHRMPYHGDGGKRWVDARPVWTGEQPQG